MKFNFEENFETRQKNLWYLVADSSMSEIEFIEYFDKYGDLEIPTKELLDKYLKLESSNINNMQLTQKQCLEDIKQIEFLIKYFYVGYFQFGVDFFNICFNKMRKLIENSNSIKIKQFQKIICDCLIGVKDYHFSINYMKKSLRPFNETLTDETFYNDEYEIVKNENNYYITINEKQHKIKLINNLNNLNKYIKKILHKNGDLSYAFVFSSPQKEYSDLIINLENCNNITIKCKKIEYADYKNQRELLTSAFNNAILYVKNQTLSRNKFGNSEEIKKKLEPLDNITKAQFAILDIRNNCGGSDVVVDAIMNKFGFINNSHSLNRFDICARFDDDLSKEDMITQFLKKYKKSIENKKPNIDKIRMADKNEIKKTSKKPLIILQNRNSCSAAEAFIELYNNHKNIIFIGDNTAGMTHFGNINEYFLNNSNLQLNFGCSYFSYNINKFMEGVGSEPDIFFPYEHEDLLPSVQKFIEKQLRINTLCKTRN